MYIPTNVMMERGVRNATAYRYLDQEKRVHTVTVGMLVDRVRELEQQLEQIGVAIKVVRMEVESA